MERRTACTRDCPDACSILATVEDGKVVRLAGDPEHPVTKGFLCYRTNRFLRRQYDPARLTTPLIRRGDTLEESTWEEALELIAGTMLRIREESGPAAILNYRCGGSLGLLKSVTDLFFQRFGPVTVKSGDVCSGAGDAAQETDFGEEDSNDILDLLNSRRIILWGKNPHVSSVHLLPILKQARSQGCKIMLIDPVHHRGVSLADSFIQPRPGGDSALALGAMRRLFESGRVDPTASSYCDNLDELRALALSRTDTEWAALAGTDAAALASVAEAFADGPCALLIGWGMQRRSQGAATVRVLDALATVSGNVGIEGGGASFYFKRRGAFDESFGLASVPPPRTIPEPLLGAGILEASDPPIRMVWIASANPICMLPDSNKVARALATRELTVVVDSHMTDTARHAHVVLPTTTMLEDEDLVGAYGHHWISEVSRVVEPPEGVLTDLEISRALAGRLGLGEEFAADAETWKRRLLAGVADEGASLEALRAGPVRNPRAPRVLFADRKFPTRTGKANLVSEHVPETSRVTPERPLLLMALSTDKAQASQWQAEEQVGPATVTVHPDAAASFKEGDLVQMESELAAMDVVLRFDPAQRRDLALMDKGGWWSQGRCANSLISAELTDEGEGAVYYDTPVRFLEQTS